ncbi:MAG: guanylate kinase [Planctomycetota bacterium]
MSSERGRLVVVSGPSGSGKTSLWKRLLAHPGVTFSVSATTRAPRPGEIEGRDYVFLSEKEFARRVQAGDFLEHAQVHGHSYGTLREPVLEDLGRGLDVVLEIDVQGAASVRGSGLPLVSVFVMPPSLEILGERLRGRHSDKEEEIRRRLALARAEMDQAPQYDQVVVNDDLDRMVAEVETFLGLQPVS